MNWDSYFESDWLRYVDLDGKPVTVTFASIARGEVRNEAGKRKMPVARFKELPKPLALNNTNCKSVAKMFGRDTDNWIGKQVELYEATTQVGKDDEVPCIRIRKASAQVNGVLKDMAELLKAKAFTKETADEWFTARFGCGLRACTQEQLRTAFRILYAHGTERYDALLKEAQENGECK